MQISDFPGDGKKHKYILQFNEYVSKSSFIPVCKTCECTEDELQGVKEKMAMDIENTNGNRVECTNITEYQDNYERGMER